MHHIRAHLIIFAVFLLPFSGIAEDFEGGNPINPWGKIQPDIIKTTLESIDTDPKAYLGQRVEFVCRYHQSENKFHSFYTGIGQAQYDGFSVWGMKNVLFKEEAFARDFPFMYVEKTSRAKTDLSKVKKFQVLKVTGVVKSAYLDKPWVIIEKIKPVFLSVRLNNNALSQARLGLSLIEDEQYLAAAKELEATLEQKFDSYMAAQVSKYCGYAYLRAGQAKKAVSYLKTAFSTIEDAESGSWWGEALVRSGESSKAISALEEVVETFPTHLSLRLAIAEAYSKEKRASGVLRHSRAILNLEKGNIKAYRFMGDVLVAKGRDDEALKIYREAEAKASGDRGEFNWVMGQIYYRKKLYKHSFNEFEIAKRSYPSSDSLALDTARAYREAGRKFHAKAARNFNRALEINEGLVGPRLELGVMHYDDEEYEASITALDGYLKKVKDHLPSLIMKGVGHERLGQFTDASNTFTKIEKLEGHGYASAHLGFNLLANKKYKESAEAYARAAWANTREDFRFDAALHAGSLYLMMDDFKTAQPLCELGYKLRPEHVPTAINNVLANEGLGRHKRSFEVLNKVKDSDKVSRRQKIIILQHWAYNALALRKSALNLDGLSAAVNEVYKARPDNWQAKLCYGWLLARSGDKQCLAILKPFLKDHLEARLATAEFFFSQGRLDEAKAVCYQENAPKSSKTIAKDFRNLRDLVDEKIEERNELLREEAEENN